VNHEWTWPTLADTHPHTHITQVLNHGTQDDWRTVITTMPPRRIKGWEGRGPVKISDFVRAGQNKLRVTSVGERFCIVIKLVRYFPAYAGMGKRARAQGRERGCVHVCLTDTFDACVDTYVCM
jgi:hypothetical protein